MSPPRPDVSEARKSQIIDAALKVFSRLGFQKARMDDIVKASGLSKGALYWYFESKDAIIVALLERLFGGSVGALDGVLAEDGPVPARLRRLGEAAIADVARTRALIPITYEFYAIAMRSKAVRSYLQRYYAEYREGLATLLQEGIDRGELREVDPEVTAVSIVALMEGLVLMWVMDPSTGDPADTLRPAFDQLVEGLELTRSPAPSKEKP